MDAKGLAGHRSVVNRKIWTSRNELAQLHVKPEGLARVAWGTDNVCVDVLERLIV